MEAGIVLECANENCKGKATIVQRFELIIHDGTKLPPNEPEKGTDTH